MRVWRAAAVLLVGLSAGAAAQSIALTEPAVPLLPSSFGPWKSASASATLSPYSLAAISKDALEECGPQRSAVADYAADDHGGQIKIHVEAIQFADRTGAYSAFTLVERPGMAEGKDLGSYDAVGNGAVLFTVGSSVVLVTGGSGNKFEFTSLKPLAEGLPKVFGSKGVAPLLPSLLPARGLVNGSLRYAVGAASYALEGGVLPANSLGWDKNAEAVTAQYADKRGKETLTVLLYPTPAIAGKYAKMIGDATPQMGSAFAKARVRREGELVILAEGSFSPDEAERMVNNIHLKQQVSFDKDLEVTPHEQAVQGYSLFKSILVLSGVLMLSAVVLGLFLGYGRALYRVMRGKPAAKEIEFLSLHLSPQNKPAKFTRPE